LNTPTEPNRALAAWLIACAALVFAMVVVGGVTRLTRSGLSIVEWEPILGVIPPLSEAAWQEAFEKYQRTPEYREVNFGMSLAEFKEIYYVEWFHRLLGRLIGLVFFGGLLYFSLRARLTRALILQLAGIFLLGGLQGALGWFMVKSGLVDVPRVSPYRLTAHLGLAVFIYAAILWTALSRLSPGTEVAASGEIARLRRSGWAVTGLVFVTILAGGFVAGTRAGFAFNDWPWMHGRLIPEGLYATRPLWADLFENVATVQFHHRLLAYLLVAAVGWLWWQARRETLLPKSARWAVQALAFALIVQIALGILTLRYVVPIPLAAAHQAGALLVLTAALVFVHSLHRHRA
jgi:cytochrome c oxidase assembly protein subunit 15